MEESKFDVFLSHNSVDKEWVIKLKNDLLRYGIKVWLDKDEIRPGDLFVHALEQGLASSRAVALIVSPETMESGWAKEEYSRAMDLAVNKRLQLIPVILREAELPGFLKNRNWVDFQNETVYVESVGRLVWGITGKKPEEFLPLNLVNREKEIELFKRMVAGQTKTRILLFGDEGQMGKSTLLRYFKDYCRFNDIFYIYFDLKGQEDEPVDLGDVFAALSKELTLSDFAAYVEDRMKFLKDTVTDVSESASIDEKIAAILNNTNVYESKFNRKFMTKALFDNIRKSSKRIVMIFDTYEKATEAVKNWLKGPCPTEARFARYVIIIVAGRETPETEQGDWPDFHHQSLDAIKAEAWHKAYPQIPYEVIDKICKQFFQGEKRGTPAEMANFLEALYKEGVSDGYQ